MIPNKPNLEIGRAYFLCGFYLRHLPIPEIETWIYIGENIFDEDAGEDEPYHYFEHPTTYFSDELAEEHSKYQGDESAESLSEQESPQRLRVADSELEALVYSYRDMREWVISLENEPNSDKAF